MTVTYRGLTFDVTTEFDDGADAPWDSCGHGVVSNWTTRNPEPGERVLAVDGHNGHSRRYYDMTASLAIAKKDGWGLPDEKAKGLKPHQITAQAVEDDFQFLRGWCADEWHYVIVIVTLHDTDYSLSTCNVEDRDGYVLQVATDLASELFDELPERITADIKRLEALQKEVLDNSN